ncbi:hypothetical protein [Zoogloea sp.]|uniref:hypothetical protein n=1 Tax=Zoogloea sp. TaxID=49181 RepID=UPI003220446F
MRFAVHGGYELPRINGKAIDDTAEAKREFWKVVEESVDGLADACGCYIYAAHNRPWYVGLASKQTFRKESLAPHKINAYNRVLAGYKQAVPYLYFIAKLTPGERFSSPSINGHKDVGALEKVLIGLAIARNVELQNISGTKFLKEMNVPGLINTEPGQASAYAVQEIRSLFGL